MKTSFSILTLFQIRRATRGQKDVNNEDRSVSWREIAKQMGSLLKSCASIDEIHKQITNQNEVQILKILLTSLAKKQQHARREIFPTEDDRIAWERQEDEGEEKKRRRRRKSHLDQRTRPSSIDSLDISSTVVRSFEIFSLFWGARANVVFTLLLRV